MTFCYNFKGDYLAARAVTTTRRQLASLGFFNNAREIKNGSHEVLHRPNMRSLNFVRPHGHNPLVRKKSLEKMTLKSIEDANDDCIDQLWSYIESNKIDDSESTTVTEESDE